MNTAELLAIKDALESSQGELELLTKDEEWFTSDSLDLNETALEIVYGALGGEYSPSNTELLDDNEYDE
jgi:hypothetical protein